MAFNFRRLFTGLTIMPVSTDTTSELGDLQTLSSTNRLQFNDGSTSQSVTTDSVSTTLTNKSLSDTTTNFVNVSTSSKQLNISLSGATASTKLTLASVQTVNRTLTLPDATDTLVGRNTTDTLTNKSIDGNNNTITNISLTTSVTGILTIANGGTNASTKTAAFNNLSPLTTLGDVIYGGASGTGTRLSGNTTTTREFLSSTGDGVNSAAPVFVSLATSDIPNLDFSKITTGVVPLVQGGTGTAAASANAAFNALSPMTTAGDLIVGGASGAGTRLGIGSTNQVLTVSAGTATWAPATGGAPTFNITSTKTTNYNAVANDYIKVDGTSSGFPVTLPTAVGVSGQSIIIDRLDMTLANVITVNTTGGQTIGDNALSSVHLYTKGEIWEFVSNNVGWNIRNHNSKTGQQVYVLPIRATSVNPTKATSPDTDRAIWRRDGSYCYIIWEYSQTSATGAGGGVGTYFYGLPTGIVADNTNLQFNTTDSNPVVGSGSFGTTSPGGMNYGTATIYDVNNIIVNAGGNQAGSGFASLTNSTVKYGFSVCIPVSGWED